MRRLSSLLRHCGRALTGPRCRIVLLEGVAMLAALALIATGGLAWRLSQGPIDLGFARPHIEAALQPAGRDATRPDLALSIGGAALTWEGVARGVDLRLVDVRLARIGESRMLAVDEIGVDLAVSELLRGRLAPTRILVEGSDITLSAGADGRIDLQIAGAVGDGDAARLDAATLIRLWLTTRAAGGPLARLDEIVLSEGRITLLNAQGRALILPGIAARLGLAETTLSVQAQAVLDPLAQPAGIARLEGTIRADLQGAALRLAIEALRPAALANWDPALAPLAALDAPLSGVADILLDRAALRGEIGLDLQLGAGLIDLPDLYPLPVPVAGGALQGRVDLGAGRAEIAALRLTPIVDDPLPGDPPELSLSGDLAWTSDGSVRADLVAGLRDLPVTALRTWWPPMMPAGGRNWIVPNIRAGKADTGEARARLARDPAGGMTIEELGGTLAFSGAEVHFMTGMPQAQNVEGRAVFDQESFDITLTRAEAGPIRLIEGKAPITGLMGSDHRIHLDLVLESPLEAALAVLDRPRLGYVSALGLSPDQVTGQARTRVQFKFPLRGTLELEEVWVLAEADLAEVTARDILLGGDLSEAAVTMRVDTATLEAAGSGRFFGSPVAFTWEEVFTPDEGAPRTSLRLDGRMDGPARAELGLDAPGVMTGRHGIEAGFTVFEDGHSVVEGSLDLTPTRLSLPWIGLDKPPGEPARAAFLLRDDEGRAPRLDRLELETASVQARGRAELRSDEAGQLGLASLELSQLTAPGTSLSGTLAAEGDAGYVVNLSGARLNLAPLLAMIERYEGVAPPAGEVVPAEPGPPILLALEIAQAQALPPAPEILGPPIMDLRAILDHDGRQLRRAGLDGSVGDGPFALRFGRSDEGLDLEAESDNVGAILAALGQTRRAEGGVLRLRSVEPDGPVRPEIWQGRLEIRDLLVRDVPLFARLINVFSPGGLADLLGGEGIGFRRIEGDLRWHDAALHLSDWRAAGSSLGLTLEQGFIDPQSDTLDLSGTLIPVYGVSEVVGAIPLLGDMLTGGDGGGIFAATYRLSGPIEDPVVNVNPLAVLTPGFLRNVFFVQADRQPPRPSRAQREAAPDITEPETEPRAPQP